MARALFEALLFACPKEFRRLYRGEMLEHFSDALAEEEEAGGLAAALRYALGAYVDLVVTAARERATMILQDIGFALRTARKSPLFSMIIVATIAIAIGANVAVYSVLSAVLLRPLPYPNPDRLVFVWERFEDSMHHGTAGPVSTPDGIDIRDQNTTFAATATFTTLRQTLLGAGPPRLLNGIVASPEMFDVLGTQPQLGRLFTRRDETRAVGDVVVISDSLWRSAFKADPAIVGKTIMLSDKPRTVVGVAPASFVQPDPWSGGFTPVDFWSVFKRATITEDDRGSHSYRQIALLKPGVSMEAANADVNRIFAGLAKKYPKENSGRTALVRGFREQLLGKVQPMMVTIYIAVLGVLLVACANVANLLLSRAATRDRELSVRFAVGASRARIIAQLLTETLLYATAGGLAGFAIAGGAMRAFVALRPPGIPRLTTVSVDASVVAYTVGIIVVTTLLAGLVPALSLSRPDLSAALKAGGRGAGGSGGNARRALVIAEIALALALVTLSGLTLRSFATFTHQPVGADIHNVYTVHLKGLSTTRYDKSNDVRMLQRRLLMVFAERFGKSNVAFSLMYPFGDSQSNTVVEFPGVKVDYAHPTIANVGMASPAIFDLLHIKVLRGRAFTEGDVWGAAPVAIVTERFVKQFLPGSDGLGRTFRPGFEVNDKVKEGPYRTIVGVVADSRLDYTQPIASTVYLPIDQEPLEWADLLVRSNAPRDTVAQAVRDAVAKVDATIPSPKIESLEQKEDDSVARERTGAILLASLAVIALFLAIAGVYGVVSYGVAQRTHEIGIRVALGARTSDVILMILRGALILAAIGIAGGLVIAALSSRLLASQLFGVDSLDLATYAS
ncbi:MAG: ABC transporter permease, partial [Candidatus Eremiobacteraeota bacterium]|nr:ABC transporter permease [Candidatus Eremiobacteraeota bacterium]